MADRGYVIIGGGLAAARAAETLREGSEAPVTIVGAERELPYERPPLSKEYLQGKAERDSVFRHDAGWYRDHDVTVRTGTRATGLEPAAHRVTLQGGGTVDYDCALLATGAFPRRLRLPGTDRPEVFYLRTLGQAEALRTAVRAATRVVIVGGGWIGLEAAAAARGFGAEVTVVETAALPLLGVLGPELAGRYAELHRGHGVTFELGAQLEAIDDAGVHLRGGAVLAADVVLIGVGARPATELAEQAGLAVQDGVLVDALLRTSAEGIWAAGDVMNAEHPGLGRRVRVEHWATALHSGVAAARSMLGDGTPYDRVPYFYSDQYDVGMEYSGFVADPARAQVVFRGDPAGWQFCVFWLEAGRVAAGMNVNVWEVTDPIQALVRAGWAGRPVDPGRLADPSVPLADLA